MSRHMDTTFLCAVLNQVFAERGNPPPRLTNAVTSHNEAALSKMTLEHARRWLSGSSVTEDKSEPILLEAGLR